MGSDCVNDGITASIIIAKASGTFERRSGILIASDKASDVVNVRWKNLAAVKGSVLAS